MLDGPRDSLAVVPVEVLIAALRVCMDLCDLIVQPSEDHVAVGSALRLPQVVIVAPANCEADRLRHGALEAAIGTNEKCQATQVDAPRGTLGTLEIGLDARNVGADVRHVVMVMPDCLSVKGGQVN